MEVPSLFKGRKIKKLLDQYAEADTNQADQQIISELAQFGDSAIAPVLEAFQHHRFASQKAQILLDKICADTSLPTIVPLIGDPYDEVRRIAKEMIIKRWPKKASPFLVEHLNSPDAYERYNAIELLAQLKDPTTESALVNMFNTASMELKKNIITVATKMSGRASKKLIISALYDDSWQVRLAAVKSLGKMKEPESVDPLIDKLDEKDPQIKMLAIDALTEIADKRATLPMLALLKDQDLIVRQKATECLIEIADAGTVPNIIGLVKDDDVNVRRCAVEVLRQMKDPSTTGALIKAIKDSDWWVRQIATDSLTAIKGDDNIVNSFIGLASDEDENIRRCAADFFNNAPHPNAFESLLTLLDDQDWWVREKAITALGKLQDKRAIDKLLACADDHEVNRVIPHALARIGGDEAVQPLRNFLYGDNRRLKIETIRAIAKEKGNKLIDDLKLCLSDQDEEVKSETVAALKILTGKVFKPEEGEGGDHTLIKSKVPPGSTVTEAILVLDLCNSTDITTRYGDSFAMKLFQKLETVVNPLAKREWFQFKKGTGDGYLITFPKATNAIHFSLDVLEKIKMLNQKADASEQINLRFAINVGEAKVDDKGDRLGAAVSMTFRVEGVKSQNLIETENGMTPEEMPTDNRVLVTENVIKEIQDVDGLQARLVGLFELKGITGLHRIFHITQTK